MRWQSVASILLGFAATLFAWIPILGVLVGGIGLGLSVRAVRRERTPAGMAGLFLCLIGTVLSLVVTLVIGWRYLTNPF